MSNTLSKQNFLSSDKGQMLQKELEAMVKNPHYNTRATYSLVTSTGAQFVEKHMNYMSNFPTMDHWQYVSNLKLKTKIR